MHNFFCNSMFERQIARNIEMQLFTDINFSFKVGMTYGVIDVFRGKGFLDPPPALICHCSALTKGI